MKAKVLICLPNGTQKVELWDFPDNWFAPDTREQGTDEIEEQA